jgi:hypothetical protein
MKLEDLIGRHKLDAVDFSRESNSTYNEFSIDEDCQVCRFRLDGVVYVAAEDPYDGYRSAMRELHIDEHAIMKNVFQPIDVLVTHINAISIDTAADILRINKLCTMPHSIKGGIILEVGTGNTEDYYPYFVARFNPENI